MTRRQGQIISEMAVCWVLMFNFGEYSLAMICNLKKFPADKVLDSHDLLMWKVNGGLM